jgi:hypothetical protein
MDGPGEEGNPGRQMQNVRLTDPEDDSDDPEFFIDIPAIERMTRVRHPGAQRRIVTFQPSAADPVAEERETAREVAVRRIPFCETNVDDVLDETGYLADGEDYERKLDTIDDSQHLDVEIVESYPSKVYNGPSPQDVKVSLDNSALTEAYAKPPSDAKRPPLRLDPFQNIRNVCWGSGATEFPIGTNIHRMMSDGDQSRMTVAMWVNFVDADPIPQTAIMSFGQLVADDGLDVLSILKTNGSPVGSLTEDVYVGADITALLSGPAGSVQAQRLGIGPFYPATPQLHISLGLGTEPVGYIRRGWNFIAFSFDLSAKLVSTAFNVVAAPLQNAAITCRFRDDQGNPDTEPEFEGDFSSIAFGGYEFALPVVGPYLGGLFGESNNSDVGIAGVQIWLDSFIDFSAEGVLAKFMKPDPDDPAKPRMVDPSIAQKAFGEPAFFFDGGPSKFVKNQGSGGEFTKIGDLKSFRPAPPKASAS